MYTQTIERTIYEPQDIRDNVDNIVKAIIENYPPYHGHINDEHIATLDAFHNMLWKYEYDGDLNLDEMIPLRLRTWIINNFYQTIEKPKYISAAISNKGLIYGAVGSNSKYYYSKCQTEISCPFTGTWTDMEVLQPIIEFVNEPYQIEYTDLINKCYHSLNKAIEAEIENTYTPEYIADDAEANGYLYDEAGNMI